MSTVSNVWQCNGDPRVVGLAMMPGERCVDINTGIVYCKQGTSNTAWIPASSAYGSTGGGGGSAGDVDGGYPGSNYGGITAIDGGGP